MEGSLCNVCLAGNLSLQSGILVCDVCGSTIEDYIEETQEYQTGLSDSRFFRKHKTSKNSEPVKVEEREPPDVASALMEYVLALQALVQRQSLCLRELFSLKGDFLKSLEEIWFAYVKYSQVLEPSFHRAITEQVLKSSNVSKNSRMQDFSVIKTVVERKLWKALPISVTLSICFLGCICTGEHVDPLDISRLALDGGIPYLAGCSDVFQASRQLHKVVSRSFILPKGVPSPSSVYLASIEIAENLQLGVDQFNYRSWIKRVVSELHLPQDLVVRSIVLYDCYNSYLKERLRLHPWAELIVYIIVAAKLGHYLTFARKDDDKNGKSVFDFPSWLDSVRGRLHHPITENLGRRSDVLGKTHSELRSYMDYLESTFARFSCPDGISDVRSALKFEGNCSFGLHPTNVVGDVLAVKSSDKKPSTNVFRNRYFVGKARKVVPSTTAELTLFLSVVSLRAWVSPNTLFEALGKLEQAILISENEIDYFSNPEMQLSHHKVNLGDISQD